MAERRMSRPPLFALLLVAAGVVLLLQNLDVIGWGFWLEVWRFWPVLLVAIGVNLILGRRLPWLATAVVAALVIGSTVWAALLAESGRDTVAASISEPLAGAERLDVEVDLGFGSLTIDSLPGDSSRIVEGTFEAPCRPASTSFQRYGDVATLDVEMDMGSPGLPMGRGLEGVAVARPRGHDRPRRWRRIDRSRPDRPPGGDAEGWRRRGQRQHPDARQRREPRGLHRRRGREHRSADTRTEWLPV